MGALFAPLACGGHHRHRCRCGVCVWGGGAEVYDRSWLLSPNGQTWSMHVDTVYTASRYGHKSGAVVVCADADTVVDATAIGTLPLED